MSTAEISVFPSSPEAHTHTHTHTHAWFSFVMPSPQIAWRKSLIQTEGEKTPHKLTKLSLRNYSGLNAAKCILWSPHFSKIIWKKTLYLIKMITVFSFFKLSISWGPIGMSGFFSWRFIFLAVSSPLRHAELLLQQDHIITISPAESPATIIMQHY